MEDHQDLTRRALWANAAFSTVTGLTLLLAAVPLAAALGVVQPLVLRMVGASLLPFAAFVALTARQRPLRRSRVIAISVMDGGWVVGTVALALGLPDALNTQGWIAAGLVAVAVDTCFVGQVLGLRRGSAGRRPAAAH